jgi:hypothetical protein
MLENPNEILSVSLQGVAHQTLNGNPKPRRKILKLKQEVREEAAQVSIEL